MDKLASIKVFLQVVRAGSFVRAAEQAGLSQTSASRMVRELEESVGTRLLNRSTRSLSLTDAGDKLFNFYSQVVDDLKAIEAEASGASPTAPSRLRVVFPHTFATRRLNTAICRFREEHPSVDLEIRLDDAPTDLIREGFDLSIRIAPALRSTLVARRIAAVPIILCAAPSYLERRGVPTTPADLAGHECLIYSDNDPPDEWAFERQGERFVQRVRGSMKANSGDLLRALAVAGQGIIFQPAFIVGTEVAAGKLISLLDGYEPLRRAAYALYPSGRFVPAKVRALTDIIARELDGSPNDDAAR
ncbi:MULTISPECIES: LysR family transcriptional regulator [Sphingomonas]|uniref:LysR family transcriptional regulator n=1 Tax=Sphingomonas TaxID=13687 RepID=UPI0013B3FCF4|nr:MULTISPECIES: LysR family transcriptional regulator [Sphingomonas]